MECLNFYSIKELIGHISKPVYKLPSRDTSREKRHANHGNETLETLGAPPPTEQYDEDALATNGQLDFSLLSNALLNMETQSDKFSSVVRKEYEFDSFSIDDDSYGSEKVSRD